MEQIKKCYAKYHKFVENVLFPLLLLAYPFLRVNYGLDVADTTYSLANFQYFFEMDGTWMVATFLANAVGSFLMHLPFGGTLLGMYAYTTLVQSFTALLVYFILRKKLPAPFVFLGEVIALGLCWCPSTILYNYLTYLLMTAGVLLLYAAVTKRYHFEKKETVGIYVYRPETESAPSLNGKKKITGSATLYYILAGVCLGANVAVRMPNVAQAAFIVAVWYGAALDCRRQNRSCPAGNAADGETAGERNTAERKANRSRAWKNALRDTLWCLAGYLAGFAVPFLAICIKYGADAYPSMVYTMFAMTDKAVDYKPTSMLTSVMSDYKRGLGWLFAAACIILAGWCLFKIKERYLAAVAKKEKSGGLRALFCDRDVINVLCKICYLGMLLVLLRIYWGRGMFTFFYFQTDSMYYPAVLLIMAAMGGAVYCLVGKKVPVEQKILAALMLVLIFVTPLGSNNYLYPIINNLFLAAPFLLAIIVPRIKKEFVWKAPAVLLVVFVLVQSFGFHLHFVFGESQWGDYASKASYEKATMPEKAANVYTHGYVAETLGELAEYIGTEGLAGKKVLIYADESVSCMPGLGYLLDMPSAVSTFWVGLDSYRMQEFERDMAQVEAYIERGAKPPVIIMNSWYSKQFNEESRYSEVALEEGIMAAGYIWTPEDKLQMVIDFIDKYSYKETFCNAEYAVYTAD